MGSLKSPCTTSYRSLIAIIALNCLVFEKIAVFVFWRQTDKRADGQTDGQLQYIGTAGPGSLASAILTPHTHPMTSSYDAIMTSSYE